MKSASNLGVHSWRVAPLVARWGVRLIRPRYDLLLEFVTRDTVLVSNPGVVASAMVREKPGAPLVSLLLQPRLPRWPRIACHSKLRLRVLRGLPQDFDLPGKPAYAASYAAN